MLADDAGGRALPVWLNGPEGHGLFRGDGGHPHPEPAEAITEELLRMAGVAVPQLRKLHGFAGGCLLCRELDGTIELTAHTFWESRAAIRAFAREDLTASVVEPEAQSALLDFDRTASHRGMLIDARS